MAMRAKQSAPMCRPSGGAIGVTEREECPPLEGRAATDRRQCDHLGLVDRHLRDQPKPVPTT